jgi:protein-tyrosine phosphatase
VIDIHSHILAGLDDGAQSIGESIDIAQRAAADGVHTIVATPHVREDYDYELGEIASRTESLNELLAAEGVDVKVLRGAEVSLTRALELDDTTLGEMCLGAGPYVLIESPYGHAPDFFEDMIFSVQLRGFLPVLAHPERSPSLMADIGRLRAMVERGVLCSVTAGSMAGAFGRRVRAATRALFVEGLVHSVASDAHDLHARPPELRYAFDALKESLPGLGGQAEWLTRAVPEAILAGEPVPESPVMTPARRRRRRWRHHSTHYD